MMTLAPIKDDSMDIGRIYVEDILHGALLSCT